MYARTHTQTHAQTRTQSHNLTISHHIAIPTHPQEFLRRLMEAGVDTLPGTSAEILDDSVREKFAKGRISAAEWVEVCVRLKASLARVHGDNLYDLM